MVNVTYKHCQSLSSPVRPLGRLRKICYYKRTTSKIKGKNKLQTQPPLSVGISLTWSPKLPRRCGGWCLTAAAHTCMSVRVPSSDRATVEEGEEELEGSSALGPWNWSGRVPAEAQATQQVSAASSTSNVRGPDPACSNWHYVSTCC
jgi:hypothetical protein